MPPLAAWRGRDADTAATDVGVVVALAAHFWAVWMNTRLLYALPGSFFACTCSSRATPERARTTVVVVRSTRLGVRVLL